MTRYGFISTYPPTRCGLATFTVSLANALAGPGDDPAVVVRLLEDDDDAALAPEDASRVVAVVRSNDPSSHRSAARALGGCDVVIVQHEYGIFGGEDGDHVISLLEALEVPAIVVLHTVLSSPTAHQRHVLERVAALASAIVVMTDHALRILVTGYDVDPSRVSVIAHGAPVPSMLSVHHRGPVARVLTWGLLSPGKGIERGIRALSALQLRGIQAEYVVAGQTHPKVRTHSGETYRDELAGLSRALGVEDSVRFVDRYLTDDDLAALLQSSDVVLLPYESHEQATSGVLVEAIAAGVPVVATAFPHAVELLTDGNGTVVAHDDVAGMVDALETILTAASTRQAVAQPRMRGGSGLSWAQVAAHYSALAGRLRTRQAA